MNITVKMNKRKKTTEDIENIVNFSQNAKYCELRLTKFWNMVATKKAAILPQSEEEAQQKAFNDDYIIAHGKPPLSCLRIKNHGAYTTHNTPSYNYSHKKKDEEITKNKVEESTKSDDESTVDEFGMLSEEVNNLGEEDMSQLLLFSDEEEEKRNISFQDKKGVPKYIGSTDDKSKLQEENKISANDIYQKKKDCFAYKEPRLVAPPEYPYRYYKLNKDEICPHCKATGRNCHNIRYGMYLAAVVARYYHQNRSNYNEFDAAKQYLLTYNAVNDFEEFLSERHIDAEVNKGIPYCLTMDSLVFALNAVEWTIMWEKTQPNVTE